MSGRVLVLNGVAHIENKKCLEGKCRKMNSFVGQVKSHSYLVS